MFCKVCGVLVFFSLPRIGIGTYETCNKVSMLVLGLTRPLVHDRLDWFQFLCLAPFRYVTILSMPHSLHSVWYQGGKSPFISYMSRPSLKQVEIMSTNTSPVKSISVREDKDGKKALHIKQREKKYSSVANFHFSVVSFVEFPSNWRKYSGYLLDVQRMDGIRM